MFGWEAKWLNLKERKRQSEPPCWTLRGRALGVVNGGEIGE